MKTYCIRTLAWGALAASLATTAHAATTDLLPLTKGYVVATCHSSTSTASYAQDPNGFVVAIVDGSTPEITAAPTDIAGGSYPWKTFHNETAFQNPGAPDPLEQWTARNLGEVFGITLDDAANPNIYVAATTTYGSHPTPAGNSYGTVYQLDGTTGDITPFNCINAGKAGLGNLTYWRSTGGNQAGHLYVTNFDDGLIYQLDLSGNCVGTYDHGVNGRPNEGMAAIPDNPSVDFTPIGRRLWGIEAHQGRLYYGVWNSTNTHSVWSVALDPSGTPDASTARIEIPAINGPLPVSDIAFSDDGRLFVAQRYHYGVPYGGTHQGSILEFTLVGVSWVVSPTDKFKVGNYSTGRNSAGGVDVECTGAVWGSGDALNYPAPYIYGITRIPAVGNQADSPHGANSHFVDLDGIITNVPKSYIGDVEIYDPCDDCFDLSEVKVECPHENGDPYVVTFKITNRSTKTAHYIWHTPCNPADLPTGGLGGQPTPLGPQQLLPNPIATGECTTVTVNLPAPNSGGKFYWNVTLLDQTGGECCTDKACIELPDCDCFIVLDKSIDCNVSADGTLKYTLSIKLENTSTFAWHYVNLLPPGLFTPPSFDLTGSPVPPGGIYTVNTCVSGSPGDAVCFNLSVHSEDIEECCSKECCIVLPPCEGGKPDECNITRVAPCCPLFAGGPPFASVVLTVCNNSPVSRTYAWNMAALPVGPGCDLVLPLGNAAFTPQNGSVTVGPNSCVNISIAVNCEGVPPGRRACYQACVRQVNDPSNLFCCQGHVIVVPQPDPVIKADSAGGNPDGSAILVPGAVTRHTVEVKNPSDQPVRFVFDVRSLLDVVEISSPGATSPEPASLKRVVVDLEPFETEIVSLDLRASDGLPFENLVVPIFLSPVGPNGEVQEIIYSFAAIAPFQRPGAPALKGIAYNPDGTFTMTLQVNPGRTYRIESSLTLGSVDAWAPATCSTVMNGHVGTEFTANSGLLELIITPDQACPENFFRAIELP